MEERLRAAAQSGGFDQLYELIREDGNILRHLDQDEYAATPLHIAVAVGHTDFVMEVMNLKPSFARKLNQDGFNPIHLALQHGQGEIVLNLPSVDNDLIRVKGRGGFTPLHYVAGVGNLRLLAKFLLSCPECIEDVTMRNEIALHIAAQYNRLEVLEIRARWLLRAYKNWEKYLEWKDKDGNSALHVAASMNQPQA